MDHPPQYTEEQIVPVIHEFSVTSHHAIEQRGLRQVAAVQDALVEYEAEDEHQFVHHLEHGEKEDYCTPV